MKKDAVPFLGIANSARSQMAEVLLRQLCGERFEVFSAGLRPTEIHALTHEVLAELGLDTTALRAMGVKEFIGKVTVR